MVTLLDGKNLSEEILGKAKAKIEYMYNNFPICDIIFVNSES